MTNTQAESEATPPGKSPADQSADTRPTLSTTDLLALERTRVAYDRTQLAWTRTAMSLITFGFSIYKFFQLDLTSAGSSATIQSSIFGVREFALCLITLGLLALFFGTINYRQNLKLLHAYYPGMPVTMTGGIGVILLAVLGLIALALVVLRG